MAQRFCGFIHESVIRGIRREQILYHGLFLSRDIDSNHFAEWEGTVRGFTKEILVDFKVSLAWMRKVPTTGRNGMSLVG